MSIEFSAIHAVLGKLKTAKNQDDVALAEDLIENWQEVVGNLITHDGDSIRAAQKKWRGYEKRHRHSEWTGENLPEELQKAKDELANAKELQVLNQPDATKAVLKKYSKLLEE